MQNRLLVQLREGKPLTGRQLLLLIVQLSIPTILAQISHIIMQYIDASMVGQLGAADSASIGLVSSSTWLLGGVCSEAATGFTVLVAQFIGANRMKTARNIMMQSFVVATGFSLLLALIGAAASGALPHWLCGTPEICPNASWYFLVFALSLPAMQLCNLAGGMLQSSGNMRVPSMLHILMCALDVVFNLLLIFPGSTVLGVHLPGANLGVLGAALGTALARAVTALLMLYFLLAQSPLLKLRRGEHLKFEPAHLKQAIRIAVPVGFEQLVMSGAQVMSTRIVSPLGTVAIAANSFAVTAESLCYMPGYGIGAAATTLIGQSIGAGRQDLTRRLGWMTTLFGVAVMTVSGAAMFIAAPWMISLLSPDPAIVSLGAEVLRIEAFAEAMYAASIVASGVFRGAGDTLVPSCMNFFSMWAVRIPLSALLAPRLGLHGAWIGMCVELNVRGILFLIRLAGKRWMKSAAVGTTNA